MILSSPNTFILPTATPNEVKNYWGASVSPVLVPSFNEMLMSLFLNFLMCSEQVSVFYRIVFCAHMLTHWCQRDCTWVREVHLFENSLKIRVWNLSHNQSAFSYWRCKQIGENNLQKQYIVFGNLQGSGWDNTIHFQKCQSDLFLNLKQVCISIGLSKICFTFWSDFLG